MHKLSILISFLTLVQLAGAQVVLDVKHVKCHGDKNGKVTVTGIGSAVQPIKSYSWSTGNSGQHITSQSNLGAGTYTVTVTDANDCTATAQALVEGPGSPMSISIHTSTGESFICGDASLTVTATLYGGRAPRTLNGGGPVYTTTVSRSSFGNGPKVLIFKGTDKNGCMVTRKQGFAFSAVSCASDPNDISGPVGVDSVRWVSSKERMAYLVRFENDPNVATAPAQEVRVTVPVPAHINPFSLRLDDFGWGPYIFDVPENTTFYQTRLDLTDSLGLYVDVTAGLDVNENQFFWILSSVDPATGFLPVDPQIGFLPVNDTANASGEGFLNFNVLPQNSALTGDIVNAQADIVFDINESILTNTWSNTLDAFPPTSTLAPFTDTTETTEIHLDFSGSDDPGGCGLFEYTLFASIDGGSFNLVAENIFDNSFTFEGEHGRHYRFFSRAIDRVGNKELLKNFGEVSVLILPEREIDLTPLQAHYCIYDSLRIDWDLTIVDSVMVQMTLDSGNSYFTLIPATADSTLALHLVDSMITNHAQIRISDIDSVSVVSLSAIFGIHSLPVVDAGDPVTICEEENLFLNATGVNSYLWSPDSSLNNPLLSNPRATPLVTTEYFVIGTDVFGCMQTDSVLIQVNPLARDSTFIQICAGDSVFIAGEWRDTTGYYAETFEFGNQCDSIFTTHLLVHDPCTWSGGDIVYVDWTATGANDGTSWADAFTKLSDALFVSNLFDNVREIWVADGTYLPGEGMNRDLSFTFEDSTRVFGGFEGSETMREQRDHQLNPVILSGDIGVIMDSTDNIKHLVTIDTSCIDCAIDGLTIKFGFNAGIEPPDNRGAGVFNQGKAHLTHVTIEQNTSPYGSAITNQGASSTLVVEDCIIRLNTSSIGNDILNIEGAILDLRGNNSIKE